MTRTTIPVLLTALLLWGCSDDNNSSPDLAADASMDGTVCSEGGVCCAVGVDCPDAAVPDQAPLPDLGPRASVCGVLQDETGATLASADVLVCNEHTCHTGSTSSTGNFCVSVTGSGGFLFHAVEHESGGKHYGDMMFPVQISPAEAQSGATKQLGTVQVPLMGPKVKLDPTAGGTLDLGGGASLTVPAGATVLPPLQTEANVAFRALDPTTLHAELLDDVPTGKSVVAAAVIVPSGVTFSSPVSFDLPLATGLTADTALEIYRVDVEVAKIEVKGQAKVSASDTLVDQSGNGLTALGVLLFVQ